MSISHACNDGGELSTMRRALPRFGLLEILRAREFDIGFSTTSQQYPRHGAVQSDEEV